MLEYNGTLTANSTVIAPDMIGFIITSFPYYANEWSPRAAAYIKEQSTQLCEDAGVEPYNEDDLLIELGMVNHDLGIRNFFGHGINVKDSEGKTHHISFSSRQQFLPAKIFYGRKEGDAITLRFPGQMYQDEEQVEVTVEAEINLAQLKTGHNGMGGFDQVIEKITEAAANENSMAL